MITLHSQLSRYRLSAFLFTSILMFSQAQAFVVDALSFALEGAEKHVSEEGGYTLRKDFWQGSSPARTLSCASIPPGDAAQTGKVAPG